MTAQLDILVKQTGLLLKTTNAAAAIITEISSE